MSQQVKDFFSTYSEFVEKVTSQPSLNTEALKRSISLLRYADRLTWPAGFDSPTSSTRRRTSYLGTRITAGSVRLVA